MLNPRSTYQMLQSNYFTTKKFVDERKKIKEFEGETVIFYDFTQLKFDVKS